jgi:glucosyl-3-phosphoglycerate synthase
LRAGVLEDVLPFARGFGMEVGMTIDAVRAGHRVVEIELELAHRATGRTLAGFAHRGRQLADFARAYLARR